MQAAALRALHPLAARQVAAARPGLDMALPGPVGEENRYALHGRGAVRCVARDEAGLRLQVVAALSTGNAAVLDAPPAWLPPALAARVRVGGPADAVLFDGDGAALLALLRELAAGEGPICPVLRPGADGLYPPDMLLAERSTSTSTNTAAAGGNAALMSL